MMNPDEILKSGLFAVFAGGVISSDTDISRPLLLLDPRSVDVSVERTDSEVVLAILHTRTDESGVNITVGEGARLSIVELYLAEAFSEVRISQRASSSCRMVCAELCGANVSYRMNLEGEGAENVLRGLFVASGADHCTVNIVTNHLVGGCNSDSMVKGVAFGQATGEFRGLVYVAEDAQNTDAMQQSRNIAHIRDAAARDICRRRAMQPRSDRGTDRRRGGDVHAPARTVRGGGPQAVGRGLRERHSVQVRCGAAAPNHGGARG